MRRVCPNCKRRKKKPLFDRHVASCRTFVGDVVGGGGDVRAKKSVTKEKTETKRRLVEKELSETQQVMTHVEVAGMEDQLRDISREFRSRRKKDR